MDEPRDIKEDLKLLNDKIWELERKVIEQELHVRKAKATYEKASTTLSMYIRRLNDVISAYRVLMKHK